MSTSVSPYSVAGNGPPLFLVHGIGAARNIWRFLIPTLEQYFTVINYDLRGHGQSCVSDHQFDLLDLVNDLEDLRNNLSIRKAHFAGHSLGGMIVPAYARQYSERVISMSLLSTAAGRTTEDRKKLRNVIDQMHLKGIDKVLPTLTARWFTDEFILSNSDIVEERLNQVLATKSEVFMNVFRIYAETEMLPWLHEIVKPALIVTGENDGGCNPRLNKLIAEQLVDSELVILPKYKHAILLEAGPIVAGKIVQFIQSQNAVSV